MKYADINLAKTADVLIVTWMIQFSVSTNDVVLVIFDE